MTPGKFLLAIFEAAGMFIPGGFAGWMLTSELGGYSDRSESDVPILVGMVSGLTLAGAILWIKIRDELPVPHSDDEDDSDPIDTVEEAFFEE